MAVQISGNDITVPRDTTVTRNLTVGGVLTYEDVTNVDSVGLVTARSGIEIGARPGVAASISVDGNAIFSGITTVGSHMAVGGVTPETFGGGYVTLEVAGSTNDNGGVFKSATSGSAGSGSSGIEMLMNTDPVGGSINVVTTHPLKFATANTERARIDTGGRLLIGGTSHQEVYGTSALQIAGTTGATSSMSLLRHGNSPYMILGSSGGSSLGSVTALSNGDRIGQITFAGADGTDINTHAASIAAYVDGSVSTNSVPASIRFQTGLSETEMARFNSSGYFGINETNPLATLHIEGHNIANGTVFLEPHSSKGNNISHIHHGSLGNWYIRPADASGYIYHDIGKSQFTNGILFGSDTAEANALDDYEEGSFTVTLANSLTVGTQTTLSYTKIGNKVHISGQFRVTSGGSDLTVTNLPFTTKNTGSTDETFSTGICGLYNVTLPTDGGASGEILTKTQKNDTNLYFVYNRNNNDPNQHTATTNGYYTVSHWYTTA